MPNRRTLSLKREVLTELANADLAVVAGAAPPQVTTVVGTAQTAYSCYAYISCYLQACLIDRVNDLTTAIVVSGPNCL